MGEVYGCALVATAGGMKVQDTRTLQSAMRKSGKQRAMETEVIAAVPSDIDFMTAASSRPAF